MIVGGLLGLGVFLSVTWLKGQRDVVPQGALIRYLIVCGMLPFLTCLLLQDYLKRYTPIYDVEPRERRKFRKSVGLGTIMVLQGMFFEASSRMMLLKAHSRS